MKDIRGEKMIYKFIYIELILSYNKEFVNLYLRYIFSYSQRYQPKLAIVDKQIIISKIHYLDVGQNFT
jgi:hypothetical protein